MTAKELSAIERLLDSVSKLREENNKFREDVKNQVSVLKSQVEKKHVPLNLEQSILNNVQLSIGEAILKSMTGYDSPLLKLTKEVVESRSPELRAIIGESFNQVIETGNFKAAIVDAFSHKVARTIISNNDGLFDKVANELKNDNVFRSKMTLAVANVVEECLRERKQQ